MSKMHELLAVDTEAAGQYKLILKETTKAFKEKANLFQGSHRKLVSFDDNDKTVYPEENVALTTTVGDKLAYMAEYMVRHLDICLQKEATNQIAEADLTVDGKTLLENVPATFLLGLESKLVEIRNTYSEMPTLQVGIEWETAPDLGNGIWKMVHPEEKIKTEMTFKSQVLYPATDKHPAQIEKWQEQAPTGKYVKNIWSGNITSARKSQVLGRIDNLLTAVKQARQRANMADVVQVNIGQKLMDYINA